MSIKFPLEKKWASVRVSPILFLKIPLGTGCHFWRKAVSVSGEVGCGLPLHVIDLVRYVLFFRKGKLAGETGRPIRT